MKHAIQKKQAFLAFLRKIYPGRRENIQFLCIQHYVMHTQKLNFDCKIFFGKNLFEYKIRFAVYLVFSTQVSLRIILVHHHSTPLKHREPKNQGDFFMHIKMVSFFQ